MAVPDETHVSIEKYIDKSIAGLEKQIEDARAAMEKQVEQARVGMEKRMESIHQMETDIILLRSFKDSVQGMASRAEVSSTRWIAIVALLMTLTSLILRAFGI